MRGCERGEFYRLENPPKDTLPHTYNATHAPLERFPPSRILPRPEPPALAAAPAAPAPGLPKGPPRSLSSPRPFAFPPASSLYQYLGLQLIWF